MKFWTSLEVEGRADKILNPIRREVEKAINSQLNDINLCNQTYQDWKWAYIAICLSPKLDPGYSEIVKRHIEDKCLEFRLRIDYESLMQADDKTRKVLYFDSLRRCFKYEKMNKWGFLDEDKEKLLAMLDSIESKL